MWVRPERSSIQGNISRTSVPSLLHSYSPLKEVYVSDLWEGQRDETQCCPHFSLTSSTARHRWWKRGPSWRKSRAAPSLKKHIHEFVQGKLSMRTGTSPFSSPAQSPGVIPANCMRFMCLPPTTLTSRQDVGRLRQEEVLDKWKIYKSRVYWHLDHVCERLL